MSLGHSPPESSSLLAPLARRLTSRSVPYRVIAILLGSLALLTVGGCGTDPPRPSPKSPPQARVERVIDGETVELTGLGMTRLIGVNAPAANACGGNAATSFTRRLEGRRLRYELGREREDDRGRTLAYVTDGPVMHNLALIEHGYADAVTSRPNDKYGEWFEAAARAAKQGRVGPRFYCAQRRLAQARRQRFARARQQRVARVRTQRIARARRARANRRLQLRLQASRALRSLRARARARNGY